MKNYKVEGRGKKKRFAWGEFDCPTCHANNPVGDGFGEADEVTCHYCGAQWEVAVIGDFDLEEASYKLIEL